MSLYAKLAQRAIEVHGRVAEMPLSKKLRLKVIQSMEDRMLQFNIDQACIWLEKHPNASPSNRERTMFVLDELMVEQAKRQA